MTNPIMLEGPSYTRSPAEPVRFKVPLATPEFDQLVAAVRLPGEKRRYVITRVSISTGRAWAEVEMELE